MKRVLFIFCIVAVTLTARPGWAAEVMPAAPAHYFNDYTNTISASDATRLDDKLSNFDKQTSNQVVVVMYPKMQSDSSIEDYTVRVAQSWKVGTKLHKNGVVLFIFKNDRKMYIQVGYGLEGALPDILAGQIINNEIKPKFKVGDFAGGINAGADAIIAATKGEYKAKPQDSSQVTFAQVLPAILVIAFLLLLFFGQRHSNLWWAPYLLNSTGRGWGGGGWSSGGGSWGGGGGFSGGGGSFGGGGAGGSW